jgi:hypothetical protein
MYSASQIAVALGKSKRAVLFTLNSIPPSSQIVVSGNTTPAWTLGALPAKMQEELAALAVRRGFQSVEALLFSAPPPYTPPLSLSEIAQHCLDKAAKTQRALARALSLRHKMAPGLVEQIAVEDYQREFGYAISKRAIRTIIKRVHDRDGGLEKFHRLELYLDDRPARKKPLPPKPLAGLEAEFSSLRDVLATFKNPVKPTADEEQYLWLRALEIFDENITAGSPSRKTLRRRIRYLFSIAPFLGENESALRRNFHRKRTRWLLNQRDAGSLVDGRKDRSGFNRAPELCREDRDALIAHAVLKCDGRVSQAWRELARRGALSEELLGYYLNNPASKSYCPTRIREAIKYEISMMDDIHHGPRQDKLNGAHVLRDWSSVSSLDWLCADDATLEVYFYLPDGQGGFTLMRGQFLVMIDVRTTRILGFALQPEKNYNARVIRTLITKICDEHGLPRQGFYFERGIWERSRILKGDPQADPLSWPETELGLRSLGLRFVHAKLPRSKPVERVIGALQDLMEGELGYVGPDEKKEKFERVQEWKREVESGKIHPAGHFYCFDEWVARLEEICTHYNSQPQDGKMTGGLSPDEAFQKYQPLDDPPLKLPANCRYLLAHHKRPLKVTSNGITLRFGKQVFNYRNEQTGHLRGQTVLAWFNPELPELLTVTDLNQDNAFCVARSQEVPAMDAPGDLLNQELMRIEAHLSYARVRYRTLRAKFSTPFRRVIVDEQTARLGNEIQAQQAALEVERRQAKQRQVRARKVYGRLNLTAPANAAPDRIEAAERLEKLLQEPV